MRGDKNVANAPYNTVHTSSVVNCDIPPQTQLHLGAISEKGRKERRNYYVHMVENTGRKKHALLLV
jgi:hypothetical protein